MYLIYFALGVICVEFGIYLILGMGAAYIWLGIILMACGIAGVDKRA